MSNFVETHLHYRGSAWIAEGAPDGSDLQEVVTGFAQVVTELLKSEVSGKVVTFEIVTGEGAKAGGACCNWNAQRLVREVVLDVLSSLDLRNRVLYLEINSGRSD